MLMRHRAAPWARRTAAVAAAALVAAAAVAAAPRPASALEGFGGTRRGEPEFDRMRLSVKPWRSKGRTLVRTSYPNRFMVNPMPKSATSLGTTLDFKEKDHMTFLYNYELRVHRRLSFDVEVGGSGWGKGKAYVHDWVTGNNMNIIDITTGKTWYNPHFDDWSLTESYMTGDTREVSANVYYRVFIYPPPRARLEPETVRQAIDIFAGFTRYEDTYRLRQTNQVIATADWFPTPPEGYLGDADSRYHYVWEGFRFGIREEVRFPLDFTFRGLFGFGPDLGFEGEGYWNHVAWLRHNLPSFIDTARGHAIDVEGAIGYNPLRFLAFEAGFRYRYFKGGTGNEKVYFSDGSSGQADVDRIQSKRHGIFASVSVKY